MSDLVGRSDFFAAGGFWSGAENRHRERFIAIVPITRYVDADDAAERRMRWVARLLSYRPDVRSPDYAPKCSCVVTDEQRAALSERTRRLWAEGKMRNAAVGRPRGPRPNL